MTTVFGRRRLLGFSLLAVTFLAGTLSGAALDRMLIAEQPERAEQRGDDADDRRSYIIERVDMSAEQRAAIDDVLERRSQRMRAVWREVEPRMDAITDSARTEIMQVLTPEQRAEYEEKLDRRRHPRGDGGSRDPGGGRDD